MKPVHFLHSHIMQTRLFLQQYEKTLRPAALLARTIARTFSTDTHTTPSFSMAARLDHPEFQEVEQEDFFDDDEGTVDNNPTPPGVDPILAEANIGWRGHPLVPPQLIDNIRALARGHNVKRINETFNAMEEHRLEFSLQELNHSSWFRAQDAMADVDSLTDAKPKPKSKSARGQSSSPASSSPASSSRTATPRKPIEYGPEESLAYTIRRSVPMYTTLSRVFAEVQRRSPGFKPHSLLGTCFTCNVSILRITTVWSYTIENVLTFFLFDIVKILEQVQVLLSGVPKQCGQNI